MFISLIMVVLHMARITLIGVVFAQCLHKTAIIQVGIFVCSEQHKNVRVCLL